MGKTKQEKKFDRNVEISAPILDPEIIKQIHSAGPKNQKRDIRHGGFKALLSDLNSQDSTDELTPITESHMPSYIGISCAVSGYSNYSSYTKRHQDDESSTTSNNRLESRAGRLPTSGLKSSVQLQAIRARTLSPTRPEQSHIHHVTIDKSNIDSVDQERKVLTEKLTASATERRRSPSPMIPPTEDDRHHGAYVGARYFPMPEPSKLVHKHIPLLGIDDDLNPDEVVVEDVNKVEHKIASLYGDNFVEDWKESMSHKSKKEHDDVDQQQKANTTPKNPKDLVSLKPTPHIAPQLEEKLVDVPTPNVKVLASVEKQFLNKLLTDENPPMPKSSSPQPTSPLSPRFTSFKPVVVPQIPTHHDDYLPKTSPKSPPTSPVQREPEPELESVPEPEPVTEPQREAEPKSPPPSPSPELIANIQDEQLLQQVGDDMRVLESPMQTTEVIMDSQRHLPDDCIQDKLELQESESPIRLAESPLSATQTQEHISQDLIDVGENLMAEEVQQQQEQPIQDTLDELKISDEAAHADEQVDPDDEIVRTLNVEMINQDEEQSYDSSPDTASQAKSPESQISRSTVERAPLNQHSNDEDIEEQQQPESLGREEHIEYDIRTESPVINNESSPVKTLELRQDEDFSLVTAREIVTDNLLSFSPEPSADFNPLETNNNVDGNLPFKQESVDLMGQDSILLEQELVQKPEEKDEGETEVQDSNVDASATKEEQQGQVKDGHYFLNLLKEEESFIMEQVRLAEQKLAEHESKMNEERLGKIHSAIGKANLLINKKCNQFRELCEKSLRNDANEQYPVLNDDLAGFWDMISIQLNDVRQQLANY